MPDISQQDFQSRMEAILEEAYNCAFVGLRNTSFFTLPIEYFEATIQTLENLLIRSVNIVSEDKKTFRLCCFTTGIKTDKPFDKDQI